jgi:hypothetical protein
VWPAATKRAVRGLDRTLGFEDQPAASAALDGLDRWVRSLPWVCELPGVTSDDRGVRYVVDCPPLGASGVWLYMRPAVDPDGPSPEVQVVLPEDTAAQAAKGGWGLPVAKMEDGRVAVSVAVPRTGRNIQALQALFVLAYDAVFALRRS